MSAPYQFWTDQARRWGACVDFGSPMTAWTPAMHAEWKAAKEAGRAPSMVNVRVNARQDKKVSA